MTSDAPSLARILVVEDNEDDFELVKLLLRRTRLNGKYELVWAATFEQGRALLERHSYAVILLDHHLGPRSGLNFLSEAKASGVHTPIILLTGSESIEVDEQALRLGAADYLCKVGLTPLHLERALRYTIRHAETQAELRRTHNLLSNILTSLPVIAGRIDANGVIVEAQGRGLETHPAAGPSLIGANVLELYPEHAAKIRSALNGGGCEFTTQVTAGGVTSFFDNYIRFDVSQGEGAIGFSVNVTERVKAEKERQRQSQLLQSIVRGLPVIVGWIDGKGVVREIEGEGLKQYRLAPSSLLGKRLADLFPQSKSALKEAIDGKSGSFTLSGRNGDEEWSADFFVSFDALRGEGAMFLGRDLTERRQLERQLLTASDTEQQRIGADLHDGLGQELTGLACLATALCDRIASTLPEEAARARQISKLANEATKKARALAHGLCPVQLEVHGLESALEDLATQCSVLYNVGCRFTLRGEPPDIDHLSAIHLYRIAQEAINNAVRHGRAEQITLGLSSRASRFKLFILDDGEGFDPRTHSKHTGRGLRLMQYRANMLGGTLSIRSQPGAGSRVACDWSEVANESDNN